MKLSRLSFAFIFIVALSACSGGGKKVLIMASGKVTVNDNDPKQITFAPGTTHNEKEVMLEASGKETLTVQGPREVKLTTLVKQATIY
jgi:hypothetical protein